ncbi:MAG: hypothetical protein ACI8SA_002063 [Dokdonia sp.]|jgi:hypothetical protein
MKLASMVILFFSIQFSYLNASERVLYPFQIKNLSYIGAFRIPVETFGESRMGYAKGTFTLSSNYKSIFVTGHTHHKAVAQFSIPEIINSNNIKELKMANMIQPFSTVFNRVSNGNKQNINIITGMKHIGNELIINGAEYYDANGDTTDTTIIIRNSRDLKNSEIHGFFKIQGAAHAAGWISRVPSEWQDTLSTEWLTGFASNLPINGRSSIGPTAFSFFPFGVLESQEQTGLIISEQMLGYSLKYPLHKDRYNEKGQNNLWTELSAAIYGFIVPNTSSYLVIGTSGGHHSGIGYKITQDNGRLCGGPCSKKHNDFSNHYWLWDVNEMADVKSGKYKPYEIMPQQYGVFDKLRPGWRPLGADFDPKHNLLFVLYSKIDGKQSRHEKAPLMSVYKINK